MLVFVAESVQKMGGDQPATSSLKEFYEKVDADPEWFPGKHNGEPRGPPQCSGAPRRRPWLGPRWR
jgi:hypothetical protein